MWFLPPRRAAAQEYDRRLAAVKSRRYHAVRRKIVGMTSTFAGCR